MFFRNDCLYDELNKQLIFLYDFSLQIIIRILWHNIIISHVWRMKDKLLNEINKWLNFYGDFHTPMFPLTFTIIWMIKYMLKINLQIINFSVFFSNNVRICWHQGQAIVCLGGWGGEGGEADAVLGKFGLSEFNLSKTHQVCSIFGHFSEFSQFTFLSHFVNIFCLHIFSEGGYGSGYGGGAGDGSAKASKPCLRPIDIISKCTTLLLE